MYNLSVQKFVMTRRVKLNPLRNNPKENGGHNRTGIRHKVIHMIVVFAWIGKKNELLSNVV